MFTRPPPIATRWTPHNDLKDLTERTTLVSGLRGFWPVLAGHLGHARLANGMIYWLRRSSPTWLTQDAPEFRVLMKYPG
jgi:hypothetical protein